MDINYLLMLQNFREATGGALDTIMEYITKLGETSTLLLILGLFYWAIDKKKGIYLMFTLFTNRIINGFIKITACVYRPWIRDARIKPVPAAMADATGYSFPSGHTTNAVSFWGGLAMNTNDGMKLPRFLQIILWVVVILIAFSRNYLGVHTPQDVVVALVIGAAVLFLIAKLLPVVEKNPKADIRVMLGGVALCALLIVYAALKSYPTDYAADGSVIVEGSKMAVDSFKNAGMGIGFFIGWFIERRFINFTTDTGILERFIRVFVCVFIFEMLNTAATPAADMLKGVLGSGISKALVQFVLILYFTAGAPAIAKLIAIPFKKLVK